MRVGFAVLSESQVIFMIPNRPPPRLRQSNRWTSTFVKVLSTCLVKDPDHRPSAHELLEVLSQNSLKCSTRS